MDYYIHIPSIARTHEDKHQNKKTQTRTHTHAHAHTYAHAHAPTHTATPAHQHKRAQIPNMPDQKLEHDSWMRLT